MAEATEQNADEFSLKTVQKQGGLMKDDGTYHESFGGTELMNSALYERVDNDLLDQFNIIKSRVRNVSEDKPNILWLHDLWNDPENAHLKDVEARKRFARLVFVSHFQMNTYSLGLGVPYSESFVLRNAIEPITVPSKEDGTWNKPDDIIRIIYHTTPHRGLNIAVAAVQALWENGYKDKIHFDVYSSFEAYGWKERDKPYEEVFKTIREHDGMTYHGFQPNDVVRKALGEAHIFAYPSIWVETSCISAIEALSAGVQIVCPNLGALPETTGNFATMYNWHENMQFHANVFANFLKGSIDNYKSDDMLRKLAFGKNWADNFYNWDIRSNEWTGMLNGLLEIEKQKKALANGKGT